MKRPAKLHFCAYLATMAAATLPITTPAADSAAPTQVLVQVDIPDQVMAAHWTKLPDSHVLRVVLDRPANPVTREDASADRPAPTTLTNASPPTRPDRGSFFIGDTIANLRGLDPVFGCRTLTLVDGRRAGGVHQSAPASSRPNMNQPYPPKLKDPRVDVWLLKADGTQILPASYSCDLTRVDPSRAHAEISYEFPLASTAQAVAAAIRIEDRYFIQKLQPAPQL